MRISDCQVQMQGGPRARPRQARRRALPPGRELVATLARDGAILAYCVFTEELTQLTMRVPVLDERSEVEH